MGYTHYWYRSPKIDRGTMAKIVVDFKKLLPIFDKAGIQLADGHGENEPKVTIDEVWFNGKSKCGHRKDEAISIPWPAKQAGGVATYIEDSKAGSWFAGALLAKRQCNGDCSYETFYFPQEVKQEYKLESIKEGKTFDCCKTAFRPYDLVVQCFLIIAKQYLAGDLKVVSDGEMEQWQDAISVCQEILGYGVMFTLDE